MTLPPMDTRLRYAVRSECGLRDDNQDAAFASARLLAVADGMGGHAAGQVASSLMIDALAHLDDVPIEEGDLLTALREATDRGNERIAQHTIQHPATAGMGTTLTAAALRGRRLGLVHVGDTRAYLRRDGTLHQLTRDDTFVQALVDTGMSAETARVHPRRALLAKALSGDPVEPTLTSLDARIGDRYLLCSDGLSGPIDNDQLRATLAVADVEACAGLLLDQALAAGARDNVTCIVADIVKDDGAPVSAALAGGASGARLSSHAGAEEELQPIVVEVADS